MRLHNYRLEDVTRKIVTNYFKSEDISYGYLKDVLWVYSIVKDRCVSSTIKTTPKIIKEYFGTYVIPHNLIYQAKQEKVQWLFIIDGLNYNEDSNELDCSNSHLYFYDIYSRQKALLLDSKELNEYVDRFLLD